MAHKLLLADDSVTIQRVIELTFADEDITVVTVGDGKQAIDRVQVDRPDIVLADIGMPERDGYEVAAFIKGNPQFAQIPVLLLTGAFEPIDESRARAVGCDGVLVKPFEPQMVISRVKDLLSGRRPAGLWAANPAAQTPVRAPAPVGDVDQHEGGAAAAPTPSADSLEDYFDRLDAAFSTLGPSAPAGTPVPNEPATPRVEGPAPIPVSVAPPREVQPPIPAPEPARAPMDALATWDPELTGDPPRAADASAPFAEAATVAQEWTDAPVAPARPQAAAAAVPRNTAAPAPSEPAIKGLEGPPAAAAMPPLSEAFAALLAAEQAHEISPSAFGVESVPEGTIDEIVRRVMDRMSTDTVRRTVVEVAERLVREEIERIKRG